MAGSGNINGMETLRSKLGGVSALRTARSATQSPSEIIVHFLLWATALLLLSGCARESLTDKADIDQQEAIHKALEIASLSIPELTGSQVAPYNIYAEKMTMEEAAKRLNSNPESAFSKESPDAQVWLVSMDGIWVGASAPGVDSPPYRHLSIAIDAKTGLEILRNIKP